MKLRSFLLHVDPALLNFEAIGAHYVEVKYTLSLGEVCIQAVVIPGPVFKGLADVGSLYTEATLAAQQNALLDAASLEREHMVGHSTERKFNGSL